ncbi:Lysozyme M1 precursor [Paenibacillus sp. P1XP2]|nr:Lysozyme M1 precursor [Paenibacillus sp. P1XP2]
MQSRNGNHAKGIDVSHWQGVIDWKRVRSAGYSFAFLKATEGPKLVDDRFRVNSQGARSAGLLTGAITLPGPAMRPTSTRSWNISFRPSKAPGA